MQMGARTAITITGRPKHMQTCGISTVISICRQGMPRLLFCAGAVSPSITIRLALNTPDMRFKWRAPDLRFFGDIGSRHSSSIRSSCLMQHKDRADYTHTVHSDDSRCADSLVMARRKWGPTLSVQVRCTAEAEQDQE